MKLVRILFHLQRSIWLFQMGRWYIWRGAPNDIVRVISAMWYFARKEPSSDFRSVIYEARKEYKLRKNRDKK